MSILKDEKSIYFARRALARRVCRAWENAIGERGGYDVDSGYDDDTGTLWCKFDARNAIILDLDGDFDSRFFDEAKNRFTEELGFLVESLSIKNIVIRLENCQFANVPANTSRA